MSFKRVDFNGCAIRLNRYKSSMSIEEHTELNPNYTRGVSLSHARSVVE